jgi:hypothetical protein
MWIGLAVAIALRSLYIWVCCPTLLSLGASRSGPDWVVLPSFAFIGWLLRLKRLKVDLVCMSRWVSLAFLHQNCWSLASMGADIVAKRRMSLRLSQLRGHWSAFIYAAYTSQLAVFILLQ